MRRAERPVLLRESTGYHHKVDFVELFFDLVFVFAITQVSHTLIEDFTWEGALQATLLSLAVWWVWIYTTWVTNWLDPAKLPVRVALLALMVPGLILSSSIPKAFDTRGSAFAGAYVVMQVGRTLFFIWAVRRHPGMRRNFQRILAWLCLSAVFWLTGSALEGNSRLAVWALALAIEVISPSLGFWTPGLGRSTTADWNVEGGHMAERCGLFIIIALGESLLVTGATFAGLAWTAATISAFLISLVGSIAMWWLYFDISAEVGRRAIAGSADPGQLARLAYTYVHLLLVGGIVLSAVADEFVLAHPTGHADARTSIAVLLGTGLFIIGLWLFRWATSRQATGSGLAALCVVAVLAFSSGYVSPVGLMALAVAVLVAMATWETYRCTERARA